MILLSLSLADDMLSKTEELSKVLSDSFTQIHNNKIIMRKDLGIKDLLQRTVVRISLLKKHQPVDLTDHKVTYRLLQGSNCVKPCH